MKRRRVSRVISYIVLVAIAVVGIAPFAYLLILSSKSGLTILDVPPSLDFDWTDDQGELRRRSFTRITT